MSKGDDTRPTGRSPHAIDWTAKVREATKDLDTQALDDGSWLVRKGDVVLHLNRFEAAEFAGLVVQASNARTAAAFAEIRRRRGLLPVHDVGVSET